MVSRFGRSIESLFAVSMLMLFGMSAHGALMVHPVSVSTTAPQLSSSTHVSNLVAQNVAPFSLGSDYGLSANYTSSTDFSTFTDSVTGALHSQHSSASSGLSWAIRWSNGSSVVNVDFDLGGLYNLTQLAIWDAAPSSFARALRDFDVYAGNDTSFTSSTLIGSFTGKTDKGEDATAHVFDLTDTLTQYVRLTMKANHGGDFLQVGEVAFGHEAAGVVPEPSSVICMGLLFAIMGVVKGQKGLKGPKGPKGLKGLER